MQKQRFWEIDFARGIAVIAMVFFNWLFALYYFGLLPSFDPQNPFWRDFAIITAGTFIFIAGVSLALSHYNSSKVLSGFEVKKKLMKRSAKIFGLGMVVTLGTVLFLKSGWIVFGILHSIGLSTLLAIPLLKQKSGRLLFAGIAVVVLGAWLAQYSFDFPYLYFLGFTPEGFYTLDFFPLFPWFGVILFVISL